MDVAVTDKRVTVFIWKLGSGGAERVVLNLLKGLSSTSIDLDLIVLRGNGSYLDKLPKNVNLIKLGTANWFFGITRLVDYLNRKESDIIFSTLPFTSIVTVIASIISRKFNGKVILRLANPPSDSDWFERFLMRLAYPLADKIVAPLEAVREKFRNFGGLNMNRVKVIHNPVDIEFIEEQSEAPVRDFDFNKKKPVIMGMGRFVEQKDFSTLISAFSRIRAKVDSELLLLGKGPLEQKLKRQVESLDLVDSVNFAGFKKNPYKYLKRADLFVLTSLYEGSPNVILEALITETPIVATDSPGGTAELLENGRLGRLVSPRAPDKLAGTLLEELNSSAPRKSYKNRIQQKYSQEKIVEQYLRLFLSVGNR